jgi:hypothetical protein
MKYFKNKNLKRVYTHEELIHSEPLFNNDLIWREGLLDWTYASLVDELKQYVIQRPPLSRFEKILFIITRFSLRALYFVLIASLLIGICGAYLEKTQYDQFISKIQPNIDACLKKEQQTNELNWKNKKENSLEKLKNRKLNIAKSKFENQDLKLELELNQAMNEYYSTQHLETKLYWEERCKEIQLARENGLIEYKNEISEIETNFLKNLSNQNNVELKPIQYNVPSNTIWLNNNGRLYTRWSHFKGLGNQEQLCYETNYFFLFRAHATFFSVVNLSEDEIEKPYKLYLNFFWSALVSNILFYPFLLFLLSRKRK